MTTTTTVTKSRVADLTREIRRESKFVDDIVHSVDHTAKTRGISIIEVLDLFPSAGENLREALNVIDGNTALLRELLDVEG